MSEWKEYKLGDAIKFGNGKVRPNSLGVIPVYGGNGILDFCSESNYEDETIIIGRVGAYCGAVYYANKPIWVSDNALAAKPKEKFHTKFLYYYLKNLGLNQFAEGSSHPLVTQSLLNSIDIFITDDVNEQRAIASILSSLDGKIDLLHRQNKTLEQLAETLFKQWFPPSSRNAGLRWAGVEAADESWEERRLGDVVEIRIGRTPPRKEFEWFTTNPTDMKWVSIKDMGESGVYILTTSEFLTREAVNKFNIPIIPKDTVLLSFKMTVGRVAITSEEMLSNEAIAHFIFNSDTPFTKEYLYLFLKTFKYDILGSTSSIVTSINSAMIKDLEISIPDEKTMKEFQKITESFFNKILDNQYQIRTLTQLRDTLLPKLMSGEIRLNCDSFD